MMAITGAKKYKSQFGPKKEDSDEEGRAKSQMQTSSIEATPIKD